MGDVLHRINFRLLGPLDVEVEGEPVRLGGGRQRTVLTMLLIASNRVVSVDALIAAVWGEGPPATARNQIAICVTALRKTFRTAAGVDDLIVTSHPGYTLNVGPHRIDLLEMESTVDRARELARSGDITEASALLTEALGLWRGVALDGAAGGLIDHEASRLAELWLELREEQAGLQLRSGRHHLLVPDLTALVRDHPLREQARAHLMLAQYRSGRRAEALEVFREGRRVLVEELGIEPGNELQELHELLLRDASELNLPPEPQPVPQLRTAPAQLPAAAAAFTGRSRELGVLDLLSASDSHASPASVALVSGIAGVGKSALAVHWANQAADHFPDGQLFADLRGFDETDSPLAPATVLDRFLRALGLPGQQVPGDQHERATLYRSILDGKRMLIVLDNARTFGQIRPLLPGRGRCRVLITSRDTIDRLTGDYDVRRIELNVLTQDEATAMLSAVAGPERIAADPAASARLGVLCDQLPLALRIAGARLAAKPHWSVRHMVKRLEDQRRRLDELSPNEGGVRAGFRLSYRGLSPAAATMYRRLGLLTVPDFAAWVGAAVLDTDPLEAEDLIEELVDAQLLEVASARPGEPPRYRFQALLRLFAWECAQEEDTPEEREGVLDRALDGWLSLCWAAYHHLYGGEFVSLTDVPESRLPQSLVEELLEDPMEWMESERTAVVDVVRQAAEAERVRHAWQLALLNASFQESRSYLEEWQECCTRALAAAQRAGDRQGEAVMQRSLGSLAMYQRRHSEADERLQSAVRLFEETDDVAGLALARRQVARRALLQGDLDQATHYGKAALAGFREVGDAAGEAHTLSTLGQIELARGDLERSLELSGQALEISRRAGLVRGLAQSAHRLAGALMHAGRLADASRTGHEALSIVKEHGDRNGEAHVLLLLGEILWRQGWLPEAERVLVEADELADDLDDGFLRARIGAALGCLYLLAGRDGAVERVRRAMSVFAEFRARQQWERLDRLLSSLPTELPPYGLAPDELQRLVALR
ncbi:BTAD domain-containing putative transcriptional regulator [Streptomyces sp. NPDC006172]|uniref:AfsR/SARP family transcriptional regulator n=1 Tax=Streptomyces sp. NPDC006172 TaxID=3154470 RepID=UPI0033C401EA